MDEKVCFCFVCVSRARVRLCRLLVHLGSSTHLSSGKYHMRSATPRDSTLRITDPSRIMNAYRHAAQWPEKKSRTQLNARLGLCPIEASTTRHNHSTNKPYLARIMQAPPIKKLPYTHCRIMQAQSKGAHSPSM